MADQPVSETITVLVISRYWLWRVGFGVLFLIINIFLFTTAYRSFTTSEQRETLSLKAIALPSDSEIALIRSALNSEDDPAWGPEDADVTIIEFSDFQCHACAWFALKTFPDLMDIYDGQIRFIYRDFASLDDVSVQAAIAAECANEQRAFWEYHDLLFENQNRISRDAFLQFAETLELDPDQFTACLDAPAFEQEVEADNADAITLGVRGTPTFFINGRILVGAQPIEVFRQYIDEALTSPAATEAP